MATRPLSRGWSGVLSIVSVIAGICGFLMLRVLFPDASLVLGFIAIATGALVLHRAGKDRSRPPAVVGVTLGIGLITVAIISVVTS